MVLKLDEMRSSEEMVDPSENEKDETYPAI